MTIQIIDLGINNVKSLVSAFSRITDKEISVHSSPKDYKKSQLTVLPGIGNFGRATSILENLGFVECLNNIVETGDHLVGICLGMQLLGESSAESPGVKGLGFIDGESHLLPLQDSESLPNIGWHGLEASQLDDYFPSLIEDKDFYFVHSYYFRAKKAENILTSSEYGNFSFTSSIIKNNVLGLQFHPEKSSKIGAKLLSEILVWSHEQN
jgi:glutamine amidotransferase